MDNPRPEKVAVVEEVRDRLTGSSAAILTEFRGLSVPDMASLRRALNAAGGEYKVYKNTLARFAVRQAGLESLEPLLQGPTAIAFVETDVVDVARALRDFGRTHPSLVIKGGILGRDVISSGEVGALAELPSRDEMMARLAGLLTALLQRFASLLQALPQNLGYGIKALIEQRAAEGGATGEDPGAGDAASEDQAVSTAEPAQGAAAGGASPAGGQEAQGTAEQGAAAGGEGAGGEEAGGEEDAGEAGQED